MLRKSEVGKVVVKEFDRTKGSGAAKLAASLKENYVGLSRKKVQNIKYRQITLQEKCKIQ